MVFTVAVADLERCDKHQNTEEEWRDFDILADR